MQRVTTQGKTKGKANLRAQLHGLPPGTLVPVEAVLDALSDDAGPSHEEGSRSPQQENAAATSAQSWRTLLWTAPAECRIGREELLEAVGRPRSWLYRHTGAKAEQRIPHRKLDGELVFVVGEVRQWLKDSEEIVQAGPLDLSARLRVVP